MILSLMRWPAGGVCERAQGACAAACRGVQLQGDLPASQRRASASVAWLPLLLLVPQTRAVTRSSCLHEPQFADFHHPLLWQVPVQPRAHVAHLRVPSHLLQVSGCIKLQLVLAARLPDTPSGICRPGACKAKLHCTLPWRPSQAGHM